MSYTKQVKECWDDEDEEVEEDKPTDGPGSSRKDSQEGEEEEERVEEEEEGGSSEESSESESEEEELTAYEKAEQRILVKKHPLIVYKDTMTTEHPLLLSEHLLRFDGLHFVYYVNMYV